VQEPSLDAIYTRYFATRPDEEMPMKEGTLHAA
jgi:hypothetical protein